MKEIINDQEIKIVSNGSNPTDFEKINSGFKAFPKLDQAELFNSVYKNLNEGKCVGIFPEVLLKF